MRFFIGAGIATAGLLLAALEVAGLEADERDVAGPWVEGGAEAALVDAELVDGQRAAFELCVVDAPPEALAEARASIRFLDATPPEVAAETVVGERFASLQQIDDAFCLTLFHWERVLVEGHFALVVDGAPESARLRGRMLAWRTASKPGRFGVLLLLIGLVIAAFARPRPKRAEEEADDEPSSDPLPLTRPIGRLLLGLVLFIAVMFGLAYVPASQALSALLRGGGIALAGAALSFGLAPQALAFRWPEGRGIGIALMLVIAGVGAFVVGRYLGALVPSTGTAPIEMVLAAPSGSLALAAVSIMAPLAEELFFRGFAFGALKARLPTWAAAAGSVVLFAVVHLPQQWGAWGAFISVTVAGVVFTLVRVKTGSSLASGLTHLAHNAFITLLAIA